MKKGIVELAVGLTLLMAAVVSAQASMFQFIDVKRPQTSAGVFNNYHGGSDAGGVLALITPTSKAPEILSGFVPLDIGGTIGKGLGGPSVALGMGLNVFPVSKTVLRTILNALTSADQFTNVKEAIAPANLGSVDLVPFIGPHENFIFKSGHIILDSTFFVGGTLKFGGLK